MKILNKIIEESKEFGKELFGDLTGCEPNTEIENDVFKMVATFFGTNINGVSDKTRNNVIKAFKKLYSEKGNFESLQYNGTDIYRYTSNSESTRIVDVDIPRTLNDFKSSKGDDSEYYLADVLYTPNTTVQSWTTKPLSKDLMEDFNGNIILLHSTNMENTIFDDDFTNLIKMNTGRLKAFKNEYEVIKITEEEKCEIVTYNDISLGNRIVYEYLEACYRKYKPEIYELNTMLDKYDLVYKIDRMRKLIPNEENSDKVMKIMNTIYKYRTKN